ncbi:hypothetical protein acsn021_00780 [Anaerocolumna cellulosilytica]|uniref:D-alanyl-D-alanine carboxypeptidase-like core domain-containing protein n=1 Tax=Anaerocolumna cellulosilytica TaxID=433286 RepID=A0A6S6QTT7_9FIRM|nr:M15 family metallopeptidase [Anaerocolumna cellulosilytica]MBB5196171.1 D-alanyl-D-alanine carboxypeptidase [Anaerocolumna cellulosilytica]BCJ92509.1 hypothetical protein acsn021_00780 [Anaerocolumna cellulosilytica]
MLSRKKKRMIKRRLKIAAIVGVPVAIICAISYISISSLSHASESTFKPGQYNDNSSYPGKKDEYNNTNSGKTEDVVVDENETEEVITNHDNLVPDTDPYSITVLVNKELPLPSDYIPEDLVIPNVEFSFDYTSEKNYMRQEAADALEELFQGAVADGIELNAVSAYRSYDRQYEIFTNNVKKQGLVHTSQYSAVPGYSEHQTGLSIDVSADVVANRLDSSFADTAEGKWLRENAYIYGYIIRYPEEKTTLTGFSYEPWHIRYVGKPLALYLYNNNLCLEEYFNFEYSKDYTDVISYDNLEDYGIDLADVTVPTRRPTRIPTKIPTVSPTITPTKVPEEGGEDEEEKPSITPTVTPTPKPSNGEDTVNVPTGTVTPAIPVEETPDDPELEDSETEIPDDITPSATPFVTPIPSTNG